MMNIAERKQATAPAEAQRWLESFEAALSVRDPAAAAGLFLDDGLWRDVLAFTWTIQTMAAGRRSKPLCVRRCRARKRGISTFQTSERRRAGYPAPVRKISKRCSSSKLPSVPARARCD